MYNIKLKYTKIYLLFIPTSIFVYIYNKIEPEKQLLNKTLFWKVCGWNILHSIAFFSICYYLKINQLEDIKELSIFMFVWYLTEEILFYLNKKLKIFNIAKELIQCKEKTVYCNPYTPRLDDFVYNYIGIGIYWYFFRK